jgi:hypothetical protein
MKDDERARVDFGPCCFCGEQIAEGEHDPCRLTVETREERWQVWFCHALCFRARLVDDPMLEPAHF